MAADRKLANAFVTARKGFCCLTIKLFSRNHEMMRIRAYKVDADEKRQMRRLYPRSRLRLEADHAAACREA